MAGESANQLRVVGIGASAGGLDALEALFKQMPARTGLAFVVIQHLSPDYKSLMPEILAHRTPMKVVQAEDGQQVEADCVYLIPPRMELRLEQGRLSVEVRRMTDGIYLPIDSFFHSLAEEQGPGAVAIILSGTGSDGTRGAQAIKDAGGLVMVQDPETAEFDGMPNSVITAQLADFVMEPEALPAQMLRCVRPGLEPVPAAPVEEDENRRHYHTIQKAVKEASGLDLDWYKPSTLSRRIGRRMALAQVSNLEQYAGLVRDDASEARTVAKEVLIGVTRFFRDVKAWDALRTLVLSPLVQDAHARHGGIRIWNVGCATGEESYTLAIVLARLRTQHGCPNLPIKIFGTDINRQAIRYACEGRYPESIGDEVAGDDLASWFACDEGGYRVTPTIRNMVVFAEHNALVDPPFGRLDLTICRNMLIYLKPEMQERLLKTFQYALRPGGYMMLGPSETLGGLSRGFRALSGTWKIYESLHVDRPPLDRVLGQTPRRKTVVVPRAKSPEPRFSTPKHSDDAERVFTALADGYIPAAVVVDEHHQVQHVLGDVSRFVTLQPGRCDLDLLKMVDAELAATLSAGLYRSRGAKDDVVYSNVQIACREGPVTVDLRIRPIRTDGLQIRRFAIYFDPCDKPGAGPAQHVDVDDTSRQRIRDLQRELHFSKENLQATMEEMESSNEELQATNEELIVSNEELQSANEELQSVNEELHTVNDEYQKKIEELTRLTEDLDNIIRVNDVGTVFLDEQLNIRKFTQPTQKYLNVLEQDLGRPVEHLSHTLDYDSFSEDLRGVAENPRRIERQVEASDGRHVLVRMDAYRGPQGSAQDGVLVTFFDVTELVGARDALARSERRYRETFDMAAAGIVHVDREGRFELVNERLAGMLGYEVDELEGRNFRDITRCDDLPLSEEIVQDLVSGRRESATIEKTYVRKDGSEMPALLNARYVPGTDGTEGRFISVITDLSERREAEANRRQLAAIVSDATTAMLAKDLEGTILAWNAGARRLYGYTAEEAIGANVRMLCEPERSGEVDQLLRRISRGESIENYVTLRRCKDGRRVHVSLTISPMRNRQGEVVGASVLQEDLTEQFRIFRKLREMDEYVRAVWEMPGRLHCVVDAEGRIKHFNDACELLTGYCSPEVRDRPISDRLLSCDEAGGVEDVLQRHREGVDHLVHENAWLDRKGQPVAIRWESIAMRDEQGRVEYILGIGSRQ
jgi:two-component system CheB/CheR fusion protein